jgi:hypothetical protein
VSGSADRSPGTADGISGEKKSPSRCKRKRCIKLSARHIHSMTTYTAKAKADGTGFNVEVTGADDHHTVLSFATQAAANEWIAQDKRRTNADDFFGSPAAPGCHDGSDFTDVP